MAGDFGVEEGVIGEFELDLGEGAGGEDAVNFCDLVVGLGDFGGEEELDLVGADVGVLMGIFDFVDFAEEADDVGCVGIVVDFLG